MGLGLTPFKGFMSMSSSWGNYPKLQPAHIIDLNCRDEYALNSLGEHDFLAYGQGRSYGDCCLNENGILITTKNLNRVINFDCFAGTLECEAGITLSCILDYIVPYGWFLPVLPGTKMVSVGGAIANDVHGKNHHHTGTFGKHVLSFELLRSDGKKIICSPFSNQEYFQATIGGLGLTGIILSAQLQLKPIISSYLNVEYLIFRNLDEAFEIAKYSEDKFEYTVAWIDCITNQKNFGRGIFMRANHLQNNDFSTPIERKNTSWIKVPFYFPEIFLNKYSKKIFNHIYFHSYSMKKKFQSISYNKFLFPLDAIKDWNKVYGRRGFLQYQCVIPENYFDRIHDILKIVLLDKQEPFLSVIKTFGNVPSPGLLSFPMEGVTLAFDLPYKGRQTNCLLDKLDQIVMECEGKVYPAKDARMSSLAFKTFFPQWEKFLSYMDPKFSSSFWRRVMQDEKLLLRS